MCEEYIGGEARIVESNCFVNSGNPGCRNAAGDGDGDDDAEQRFSPSWHRGTDLPYANHVGRASGLTHCNFVKALTNLTELCVRVCFPSVLCAVGGASEYHYQSI
jgi:hypothetical protein